MRNQEHASDDLREHDLRWLWLAMMLAGGAMAGYWLAKGGELYRTDEEGGVAGAAATTVRFAVLLAVAAAAVELVGMIAAARSHYVSGGLGIVCAMSSVIGLAAAGVHAQAALGLFGTERDPLMAPAIGALLAMVGGGVGLWRDARREHAHASAALADIERRIHETDHDLM